MTTTGRRRSNWGKVTTPARLVGRELFGQADSGTDDLSQYVGGRFAMAHGGTILLDEIAEMPRDAQAQLLRYLQARSNDDTDVSARSDVDVRVIVSSYENLENAVRNDVFRQDLYHNPNVLAADASPLRKRGDGIQLLAVSRYFGDHLKLGVGYNFTDFSDDLTELSYDHSGFFVNLTGSL